MSYLYVVYHYGAQIASRHTSNMNESECKTKFDSWINNREPIIIDETWIPYHNVVEIQKKL